MNIQIISLVRSVSRVAGLSACLVLAINSLAWAEDPALPVEVQSSIEVKINGTLVTDLKSIVVKPRDTYQLTASFPNGARYAYFNFTDWRQRLGIVDKIELDDQTGNEACRLNEFSQGSYIWCQSIDAPGDLAFVPTVAVSGIVNSEAELGKEYTTLLAYRANASADYSINGQRRHSQWIRSVLRVIDDNPEFTVLMESTSPEDNDLGFTPLSVELLKTSADVKGVNLKLKYDPSLIRVEQLEMILADKVNQAGLTTDIPEYFSSCGSAPIVEIDAEQGVIHYEARAESIANLSPFWPEPRKCNGGSIMRHLEAVCIEEGTSVVAITKALLDLDGSSSNGDWNGATEANIGEPVIINCEAFVQFSIRTEIDQAVNLD